MAKVVIIKINKELCKECGLCASVCPDKAIKISDELNSKGYHPAIHIKGTCQGCSLCAIMCPEIAIEVFRE